VTIDALEPVPSLARSISLRCRACKGFCASREQNLGSQVMTRVGIVGGLGPESTVDYYRRILEAWERVEPSTAPSIIIDSLDVQLALRLVATDRQALTEYLLDSLRRLHGAGVDFAAMTANTPHIVFDELAARSPVPLVSIVEVCAHEAQRRGLKRLGLLGTRFTMEAPFYPEVCARYGVAVVTPDEADRAWVHERYVGQLLKGDFRDDTRQEFVSLVGRLRDEEHIDGIILGGTELPLLLPAPAIADLPALDTTALHVAAIVKRLRQADGRPTDAPAPEV
jgi:aspartate racemase